VIDRYPSVFALKITKDRVAGARPSVLYPLLLSNVQHTEVFFRKL